MADQIWLRNTTTGEIRTLEPFGPEHLDIREERDDDNRYVWQQTSSADADPEQYAHPTEVAARKRFGLKDLSMVKADGTPTSKHAAELLAKHDPGMHKQPPMQRDPDHPEAGPHAQKPDDQKPRRRSTAAKRSSSD